MSIYRVIESLDGSVYKLLPPLGTKKFSPSRTSVVKFSEFIIKTRKVYDSWSVCFHFCDGHLTNQVLVLILHLKLTTNINKVRFLIFKLKHFIRIGEWGIKLFMNTFWSSESKRWLYCSDVSEDALIGNSRGYLKMWTNRNVSFGLYIFYLKSITNTFRKSLSKTC